MNILITGATGNVGRSVVQHLAGLAHSNTVVAGVRMGSNTTNQLDLVGVSFVHFDFESIQTFQPALQGIDVLFLLRPPQRADVDKYFKPLIDEAIECGVQHIVFLSVQGVEDNRFIPHHKIEKLITERNVTYTFLRPAYFMQNFTTTLRRDLVNAQRIYLPAGQAKFTLIDVDDIGAVASRVLTEPDKHQNRCYVLTSAETLTFEEMAARLSSHVGRTITYISPNVIQYYFAKRREGVSRTFILVMIMLHYLPRFKRTPPTSDAVKSITGKDPKTFDEFISRNLRELMPTTSENA
ncbi:SDR family oxidoreductase [soil metagenome]